MSVNGITNAVTTNDSRNSLKPVKNADQTAQETVRAPAEDVAVVYEPGASAADPAGKTYSQDTKAITKLKADAEKRSSQLKSLVEQLLLKQGYKFTDSTNIYALLREGKVDVDPETAAKAQEEISENGYWGVEQTSERLFSFATSLAGGDPARAQEMKDAFIAGYKEAEKAWGGELPEISRKTYEATIKKFDEWIGDTQ